MGNASASHWPRDLLDEVIIGQCDALAFPPRARAIITLLDEEWDEKKFPLPSTVSTTGDWLGGLSGTAQIVGDIISSLEETWDDWEILS